MFILSDKIFINVFYFNVTILYFVMLVTLTVLNCLLKDCYCYLISNLYVSDTGIVHLLGDKTFTSLFNIKQRQQVSLSFAVDYSGSMSGEIAAVKEEIIQLVTSTIGSENEPADYVLSLFSDPGIL